jgi:hypothetical protein
MPTFMNRRHALTALTLAITLGLMLPGHSFADELKEATLYKNPECGCCGEYAKLLQQSGFDVQVVDTFDLPSVKREHSVPAALEGCHTTLVDGYVIEGHVPVDIVQRLLREKPAIKGISLPGMPPGSPGMMGEKTAPFTVYEISDEKDKVYATE